MVNAQSSSDEQVLCDVSHEALWNSHLSGVDCTITLRDISFIIADYWSPSFACHSYKFWSASDFLIKVRKFFEAYNSKVRRDIEILKPPWNRAQKDDLGNTRSDLGGFITRSTRSYCIYSRKPLYYRTPEIKINNWEKTSKIYIYRSGHLIRPDVGYISARFWRRA